MIDNSQIVFDDEVTEVNETKPNNEGSDESNPDGNGDNGDKDIILNADEVNTEEVNNEETNTETQTEDDEEGTSILDILSDITGMSEFTDEDGNAISFNDDEEGVKAYLSKVKESYVKEATEAATSNLFNNFPELHDAYNYLRINGSLDGFNKATNWDGITLEEKDTDKLKDVVKEYYKTIGKTATEPYMKYLEESGELFNEAKSSLEFLKENDIKMKADAEAQIKAAEEKEIQETISYWKDMESIINSGDVLGYKLPDTITVNKDGKSVVKSKSDFYNYMSKAVKDGKSQYELDLEKEDAKVLNQEEILKAYLKFTGNNYKSIINMELNKEKVNNNKKLIVKSKTPTSKSQVANNSKATNDQIVLD